MTYSTRGANGAAFTIENLDAKQPTLIMFAIVMNLCRRLKSPLSWGPRPERPVSAPDAARGPIDTRSHSEL